MPTICIFFGIVIRMFYNEKKHHNMPHFHAYYQGQEVSLSLPDLEILEGELPSRQMRLVLGWAEVHKEDLMANWELAEQHEPLIPLRPL